MNAILTHTKPLYLLVIGVILGCGILANIFAGGEAADEPDEHKETKTNG
jgi:hypothetical protein